MSCRGFVPVRRLLRLSLLALATLAVAPTAHAEKGKLLERLTPDVMAIVSAAAERLGPEEHSPPAIAVYNGDKVVVYIFSTLDIVNARASSLILFHVLVGVPPAGRLR